MFLHLKKKVVKLQHVKRVSFIFENLLKLSVGFDILVAIKFVLQLQGLQVTCNPHKFEIPMLGAVRVQTLL